MPVNFFSRPRRDDGAPAARAAEKRDSGLRGSDKTGWLRSGLRRYGPTAAVFAGGLVALDLLGFVASVYFGPQLLDAAEAAGVAELLQR